MTNVLVLNSNTWKPLTVQINELFALDKWNHLTVQKKKKWTLAHFKILSTKMCSEII